MAGVLDEDLGRAVAMHPTDSQVALVARASGGEQGVGGVVQRQVDHEGVVAPGHRIEQLVVPVQAVLVGEGQVVGAWPQEGGRRRERAREHLVAGPGPPTTSIPSSSRSTSHARARIASAIDPRLLSTTGMRTHGRMHAARAKISPKKPKAHRIFP